MDINNEEVIKNEEIILEKFSKIFMIDIRKYVENKNGFNYLSWANAWKIFKEHYPDATYTIKKKEDGTCYFGNERDGFMVYTTVTADCLTYEMWLPIMDLRNKSLMKVTTMDVNKAVMRCLVKNLSMHGLGLYIYAGEDLPVSRKDFENMKEEELRTLLSESNTFMDYINKKGKTLDTLDKPYMIETVCKMYGLK